MGYNDVFLESKSKWDVVEEENKRELPPARQEVPKRDVKKGTEEEPNSAYAEYMYVYM